MCVYCVLCINTYIHCECKLVAQRTASYYSMPRPELLHEGIWQRPQIARAFLSEHLAQSIREPSHNRTQSRKGTLQYVPIVSSSHSCLVRCLCVHPVHPCTYLFSHRTIQSALIEIPRPRDSKGPIHMPPPLVHAPGSPRSAPTCSHIYYCFQHEAFLPRPHIRHLDTSSERLKAHRSTGC